jgi:hypothetical protein
MVMCRDQPIPAFFDARVSEIDVAIDHIRHLLAFGLASSLIRNNGYG